MLTRRDEAILKAVHYYRYMTAQDVAYLLFEPSSITHVREILSTLAGKGDNQANQYLYRFKLPKTTTGNSERVYTLGSRGRDVLANALDVPVDWFFRPNKMRFASYSHLAHSLLLTRFLVALRHWLANQSAFTLEEARICYELAASPVSLTVQGRTETVPVIPDAWLHISRTTDNKKLPILLEIDRGTEYQRRFKQHIRSRIEFVRSGAYSNIFGTKGVLIAYITTGERAEYRETRCKTMCTWTQEILAEMRMDDWAQIFRFASLLLNDFYKTSELLFDGPVWYRPDAPDPIRLLTH